MADTLSGALKDIKAFLNRKIQDIDNHAGYAILKATNVGHNSMKRIIETTTSETGEARAARGGHPGRVDTWNMYDAVDFDVQMIGSLEQRVHYGEWGWIDGAEQYFLYQEDGTSQVAAMKSLQQSYTEARGRLIEELNK